MKRILSWMSILYLGIAVLGALMDSANSSTFTFSTTIAISEPEKDSPVLVEWLEEMK